jgi:hypothetical protein
MGGSVRGTKAAIGVTLAVALAVGASIVVVLLPDEKPQTGIAGQALGPNESPLAGGEKVSLQEATAEFKTPIYRPDMALASDDVIRDVWMSRGVEPLIYMRYKTGVVLKVGPPAGRASTEEWAEALMGDGVAGAIKDITGIDVFVVSPHHGLGSVRFFLRNTHVVIIGDHADISTDQLRSLAASAVERADVIEAEKAAAA